MTREKITPSLSHILIYEHMGHTVKTMFIIGYSEAPGWPFNNQTISIYIIQYGSTMFRIFLSCRIHYEVSADAAADAAYVTTTEL